MIKLQTICSLATGLFFGSGVAHAQHSASVVGGVEWVENPTLSATSPGAVTVLRVVPSYTLEIRADRSHSRLSLGAVLERSSNTALVASRNYPSLGYTWTYFWPTSSLELRGNLAESSTRNTEFEEFGRVTVDSRERTLSAAVRWTQELTERTDWVLNVARSTVGYDVDSLSDYSEIELSSRVSWEATEGISYFIEPAYVRLTRSVSTATLVQARWQAGVSGELAAGWTLTSFFGQAHIGKAPSKTGTLAGLQLAFVGSRWLTSVDWSRDFSVSVADTTYVRTEALVLRQAYRLTEGATLSASVAQSHSEGANASRGLVSSLVLENELGVNWSSSLGVEHRRSTRVGGSAGRGWSVRAGVVYAYPGR